MINSLQLIRNVGQFDSLSGANFTLMRLTAIYAENGRGKTTLAAILRSLGSGDPHPILERRRLPTTNPPPHIVVDCIGGPPSAIFQTGTWNRILPRVRVFDDVFVDQNVYSGLAVDSDHRQSLHELIIGVQGVSLNRTLQNLVNEIEVHNTALRAKGSAIPASERGTFSIDDFCTLPSREDIDTALQSAERNLAAAKQQEQIQGASSFDRLSLPEFDIAAYEVVLQSALPTLEAVAANQVQAHLAGIGQGGESWVSDGVRRVQSQREGEARSCPFCAQDLRSSPVISHYQAYFSQAYAGLKRDIANAVSGIAQSHGGEVPAAFERAIRVCGERRQFWSQFCEVPEIAVDTVSIALKWREVREALTAALKAKQGTPLERIPFPEEVRGAVTEFNRFRGMIADINSKLQATNTTIKVVKEQAATGNLTSLLSDVVKIKAIKVRHMPNIARLCEEYLSEKAAKIATEQKRDQARATLNQYQTTAFPAYNIAINEYLRKFNTGFRLAGMTSANTRGGITCNYNVVIGQSSIPISGGEPRDGEPSFRSTLSAGDRNALALAFFFASLDQDPQLADKVIVIDDPMTSLDEHRAFTTVQEVRRLTDRVTQVIVLSHSKPFLCRIWESADRIQRCSLQITRDGTGSTISVWDVSRDSITEYDRRHELLRRFVSTGHVDLRQVAESIRPVLEGYLRIVRPEDCPPGTMIGRFHASCLQRLGTPEQILNNDRTRELGDLKEYANRFHHDTNQAWETEHINDQELLGFVNRALAFVHI